MPVRPRPRLCHIFGLVVVGALRDVCSEPEMYKHLDDVDGKRGEAKVIIQH